MLRIVLLAILLLAPAISAAEIIKWVDEKGNVGYADDLGNVPPKYRDKAMSAEKSQQAVEIMEKPEPERTPHKKDDASLPKPVADDKAKDTAKPLFDGKEGETWRRDFAKLKFEIASLEEQAAGMKNRLADPSKMSRGEYLSLQNTAKDLDVRTSVARKKLEALEAAADRAELPADFR